jgi:hypothetical protein
MPRRWLGPARYLFIPLVVTDSPGWFPPPPDFQALVRRRAQRDLDPATGEDRSLASYIASASYGRASLDATVSAPVTLRNLDPQVNPTLLAIQAHPDSHRFEYLAVVYPSNALGRGGGMAASGRIDFDPPRTPNLTRARSRFLHDEPLGTWAMEVMHNVTDIGDYYNGVERVGDFDLMDGHRGTHPSAFTKLAAGWLDASDVVDHPGGTRRYVLRAVGHGHPGPGQVAAVRISAQGSDRHLIIEARVESDRWDRGFEGGSVGIPSQGVVVYERAPDWPRRESDPNGPKPPLQLRTRTALGVGQSFSHEDTSVPDDRVRDHRTGRGRYRSVRVRAAIAGGYEIEVTSDRRVEPPPPPTLPGTGPGGPGDPDDPPRHDP